MRLYDRLPKPPKMIDTRTHRWFAWYPVRGIDGDNDKRCWIWMETVWKRWKYAQVYDYRTIPQWAQTNEQFKQYYPFQEPKF